MTSFHLTLSKWHFEISHGMTHCALQLFYLERRLSPLMAPLESQQGSDADFEEGCSTNLDRVEKNKVNSQAVARLCRSIYLHLYVLFVFICCLIYPLSLYLHLCPPICSDICVYQTSFLWVYVYLDIYIHIFICLHHSSYVCVCVLSFFRQPQKRPSYFP